MKNFDEKRQQLKAAGWNRRDRHNEERWVPPWDGDGMEPMSMTFEQAWRRFEKAKSKCKGCGNELDPRYPCRCGYGSSLNRIEPKDVARIAVKDMQRLGEGVILVSGLSGPDVMCQCGHPAVKHYHGRGMCEAPQGGYVGLNVCQCRRFKRPVEKVEEPLPCPFCGSKAEEMGGGFICTNEYCPAACGSIQLLRGRDAKLRQWNKRVKVS